MAKPNPDLERLSQCRLFSGISEKHLERIRDLAKEVRFEAGRELTEEGTEGARFYLILDGEVDVIIHGQHRGTRGPGDSIGEYSLLDGQPRSATVVAKTPVRTLSLASWNFRPLLAEEPSMAEALLVELCRRLRETEAELTRS